jgi:hypothetical protein
VCSNCHALVHAARLEQLAASARLHEGAILLANGKFLLALFKLKFLLSLGTFVAFYWALYGAKLGVGFAMLLLVSRWATSLISSVEVCPRTCRSFSQDWVPMYAGRPLACPRRHAPLLGLLYGLGVVVD